jgi:hypothetical protein
VEHANGPVYSRAAWFGRFLQDCAGNLQFRMRDAEEGAVLGQYTAGDDRVT